MISRARMKTRCESMCCCGKDLKEAKDCDPSVYLEPILRFLCPKPRQKWKGKEVLGVIVTCGTPERNDRDRNKDELQTRSADHDLHMKAH